jgi:predicted metal-binding membrane protein
VYGLPAFVALLGTGRLADSSPSAAKWLGVAIFAVAGIYQLTPAKRWALAHCRMVMATHGGRPITGGFVSGARDGAICVGCCWALMTILFAVGVMNLWAMVGLAVVIFAEKILPRPGLVAALAGIVFLGLAVVAAVHPSILSGLHVTNMGMDMGGM